MSETTAHEPSQKAILLTGAALLVLWAGSYLLSTVDLGRASLPIAIAIAVAKALLVVLFFMELAIERTSVKLTLVTAMALALLLGGFMVADVMTRDRDPLAVPGAPSRGQAPLPSR
jgi:cytochrome c oxidase subunit 4